MRLPVWYEDRLMATPASEVSRRFKHAEDYRFRQKTMSACGATELPHSDTYKTSLPYAQSASKGFSSARLIQDWAPPRLTVLTLSEGILPCARYTAICAQRVKGLPTLSHPHPDQQDSTLGIYEG